jgi:ribonucleoside-diphosphate reductase alpha chain
MLVKSSPMMNLEELCELSVRALEELIDYQKYPVMAAEVATKARRSLGIGYIGLAHYLAKLGFKYDSQGAWDAVHGLSESFQYFLLKASNKIAQEKGYCESFGRTKYSQGLLPIDTYKKDVDEISSVKLQSRLGRTQSIDSETRSQTLHTVRTDALREQFCGI